MSFDAKQYAEEIRGSTEMVIAAAQAVPADKLAWSPGGVATTVLQNIQHCADFPAWCMRSIEAGGYAPADEDAMPAAESLEAGVAALRANSEKLIAYAETLSAEELAKPVSFPWETTTVAGVLGYHHWNNTYHLGQLNYIQLILGDTEFHLPG